MGKQVHGAKTGHAAEHHPLVEHGGHVRGGGRDRCTGEPHAGHQEQAQPHREKRADAGSDGIVAHVARAAQVVADGLGGGHGDEAWGQQQQQGRQAGDLASEHLPVHCIGKEHKDTDSHHSDGRGGLQGGQGQVALGQLVPQVAHPGIQHLPHALGHQPGALGKLCGYRIEHPKMASLPRFNKSDKIRGNTEKIESETGDNFCSPSDD